jgi:hypothetical protein
MAASEFAISMSQPNLLAGNFPERGYNLAIASLQQALCPVKKLFRPFSCEYYEAEAIWNMVQAIFDCNACPNTPILLI